MKNMGRDIPGKGKGKFERVAILQFNRIKFKVKVLPENGTLYNLKGTICLTIELF